MNDKFIFDELLDGEIDEDLLELCNEAWEAAVVEAAYEQNNIELAQMPCSKTRH